MSKLLIISDKNLNSLKIKRQLLTVLEKEKVLIPNLVIVIGGDGFMLQTLKKYKFFKKIFYGLNSGNYGFLMNKFSIKTILKVFMLSAKNYSEILLHLRVVPSARLELALRKRQGF